LGEQVVRVASCRQTNFQCFQTLEEEGHNERRIAIPRRARSAALLAAERLHGDDTTVPVLAKDKTVIGRVWAYVRDDRPFAGPDPPAALFFYSRNRNSEHPNRHLAGYAGILQADVFEVGL
jgi:hypothetical protein